MNVAIKVTRLTRQGSILSPCIFGISISDLLMDLSTSNHGVRISSNKFDPFAYADDVKKISATVPGLQRMINK